MKEILRPFAARIPDTILTWIEAHAKSQRRSTNSQIIMFLLEGMHREFKKPGRKGKDGRK